MLEDKKYAQLGSFEAENNPEAVNRLIDEVLQRAKSLGFDGLIGPMNGSTWHNYRFNVEEGSPFFTETWHPAYYPNLWEASGFEKCAGYYSSLAPDVQYTTPPPNKLPEDITIRNIELNQYQEELKKVFDFCQEAFAANFLYTPISWKDFLELYTPLEKYIDPRLVLLAEHQDQLVGLVLAIPDHYHPNKKRVIVKTLARHPGKAYNGLGQSLSIHFYRQAQKLGHEELIYAFMLDQGYAKKVANDFFSKPFKHYNLYKRDV